MKSLALTRGLIDNSFAETAISFGEFSTCFDFDVTDEETCSAIAALKKSRNFPPSRAWESAENELIIADPETVDLESTVWLDDLKPIASTEKKNSCNYDSSRQDDKMNVPYAVHLHPTIELSTMHNKLSNWLTLSVKSLMIEAHLDFYVKQK